MLRMRNGTSKSPFRLPLGDSLCAPVRPAPGPRHQHGARPLGARRPRHGPCANGLTACRMRLHTAFAASGPSGPSATAAARPRPTPTGGQPASLRSPCRSEANGPLGIELARVSAATLFGLGRRLIPDFRERNPNSFCLKETLRAARSVAKKASHRTQFAGERRGLLAGSGERAGLEGPQVGDRNAFGTKKKATLVR